MNRTQKMAWFGFLGALTISIIYVTTFIILFLTPGYLQFSCLAVCIILMALFVGMVWVYRKKQSPSEPDCDERDSQISRQAVVASFASLCLLIYISDALVILWTGFEGVVPTSILPAIHLELGFLALALYYATMIILYGKDNKLPEGGEA